MTNWRATIGEAEGALHELAQWDALTSTEQEELARAAAVHLPTPFRFAGMQACRLGAQQHRVAVFDWHDACFALIPGGHATLGYDPEHPYNPTAAQLARWQETARDVLQRPEYALEDFLRETLTPCAR